MARTDGTVTGTVLSSVKVPVPATKHWDSTETLIRVDRTTAPPVVDRVISCIAVKRYLLFGSSLSH